VWFERRRHIVHLARIREKSVRLNPFKPNLVKIIFKNYVCTSKRTPHFTIKMIMWLMLFKEIIAVYTKNVPNALMFGY
jgi:hypothetical protein